MIKPGTIRFILALIVVIGHAAPSWIFIGHFAVICFFILSGYWISKLFDQQYSKLEKPVLVFYISRIWRLLPLLLLFTLLAGVVSYFFNPALREQILQLTAWRKARFLFTHLFTLGLSIQSPKVLAPAWSLDIELQFYILFPLIYYFIGRYGKGALTLLLLIPAIVTGVYTWILLSSSPMLTRTICYFLVFFLVGALIYFRDLTFSRRFEYCCNLLFLVPIILLYLEIIPQSSRIANELLPFLLIPLISNSVRKESGSTDLFLGSISYVLYLAHWVCLMPFKYYHLTDKQLPAGQHLAALIVYLLLTAILSYSAYVFVDKKLNLARKRWVARQAPAATSIPAITVS